MHLPSASQYLEIVENNEPGSLATLRGYQFIAGGDGRPCFEKGNYAIVFKTEYQSRNYAVRFFLDSESEVFERYRKLNAYLEARALYWKVPFQFLDKEVFLDGEYYPALVMDWIDSLSFTEYLDLIINDPFRISLVQKELLSLSQNLEKNGIGHGNLNLKQVRFLKQEGNYVLKLIDYDSMFIPPFRGKDSVSPGTAGFQHPMRLSSDFSETIDRFSFWVFLTALEAFKQDSSLWENAKRNGFDKEEQILFTYRDLAFPQQSVTFELLKRYRNEALDFYSGKLIGFCNLTSLDAIEAPQLLGEKHSFRPKREPPALHSEQPLAYKNEEILTVPANKPVFQPAELLIPANPVSLPEKLVLKREKKETVHGELTTMPGQKQEFPISQNSKRKFSWMIVAAILLVAGTVFYFWGNRSFKTRDGISDNKVINTYNGQDASASKQSTPPVQPTLAKKEENIFTPENITQFLFQLYQSYNKRDLQGILANYKDSVSQYYDTYAVKKYELTGMIKNLFINPVYYECQPDIRTLQINAQGKICKLTVGINETIQANKRSKKESYSSKIEYMVDSAFKILSEKNVQ